MNIFSKHLLSSLLALALAGSGCAVFQQAGNPAAGNRQGTTATDQQERPVPNSITPEIPYAYKRAVEQGTRSGTGAPGPEYWQQRADYSMDVELFTDEKRVAGSSTITYYNNSPNTLNSLVLELAQNVHAEGVPRNESVEVTGGIQLNAMSLNGAPLEEIQRRGQSGYVIDATRLILYPAQSVNPDDTVTIEAEWSFEVPQRGAGGRMGYSEDNLFFIAYWYPQVMVYDDVFGWFTDVFTNNAEFYHEFGRYDVSITAPEQWIVTATGQLQNAEELLAEPILERYRKAMRSDTVVRIADTSDSGSVTKTGESGKLTWSFSADKVRDFAFSATRESIWEGARTSVGDRDGDGREDYTFVDALYRQNAGKWRNAVTYAQHSMSFLSDLTGLSYPWPHMTSVEGGGIIGGGMEFPMMTLIGSYRYASQSALYYVIAHEIAHMWVPMIVSTNERRFSWMDEGTTTYNENQARKDFFPNANNPELSDYNSYNNISGTYLEGPILRWSDYHYPGPGYGTASYSKPASGLVVLRNLLGDEVFMKAYRAFLHRWKYKHPYPWDMFNTFEDVSGRDLDWFWRSFYYETWVLDQAVGEVRSTGGVTRIEIEDRGQMPLPATVKVTFADGSSVTEQIDVQTWLNGATKTTIRIEESSEVVRVEIDPEYKFPDANRSNNTWHR